MFSVQRRSSNCLTSESVQGASLPLEGIDHIHGGDCLPLGVFGVGDGVPDDVLKEHLEHSTGLLVDEARDTLHTTAPRKTTDGGLGDALDVVPQHLAMALGTTLSQSFASFAASSHSALLVVYKLMPDFGSRPSLWGGQPTGRLFSLVLPIGPSGSGRLLRAGLGRLGCSHNWSIGRLSPAGFSEPGLAGLGQGTRSHKYGTIGI